MATLHSVPLKKKKKKNHEIFLSQGNLGFICAGFRRMPTGR